MSRPSTQLTFADVYPSFRVASPVNHLAQQESGEGHPTIDISGRKCLESFERLAPHTSWRRTFAASLVGMTGWFSTRCALTWKVKATKSFRSYFLLQASTRRTEGTASGLLLTPTTREEPVDLDKFKARMEKYPNGTTMPNLATQVQRMLPTPMAQESDKITGKENQDSLTKRARQETGKTSQLSPLFVEEMMGFPRGWTASPFQSGDESP